jgi:xanthine dehydrogenase iron-sulfur cluster and FAD-binding subunit A
VYGPRDVRDDLTMNDFLRKYLGMTGTKFGCARRSACRNRAEAVPRTTMGRPRVWNELTTPSKF